MASSLASSLKDTRLQLHYLAQVPWTFAKAYCKPHPLWYHTAFHLEDGWWRTEAAEGADVHAAFRMADGTIAVRRGAESVIEIKTDGKTLETVQAAFRAALAEVGLSKPLEGRDPAKMPAHPVAAGTPIQLDAGFAARLDALYTRGYGVIGTQAGSRKGSGPTVLFSHHFDISSLRTIVPGKDPGGEDAKSVTIGLSPGDSSYDVPYWYVTMWPYPKDPTLPKLPGGAKWHTEGWTGAVLLDPEANVDAGAAAAFLAAAAEAAEALVMGTKKGA